MNKEYFRYLIRTAGYMPSQFAQLLGIKLPMLQYKVRTGTFKINEIHKICELLEKPFEEIFKK